MEDFDRINIINEPLQTTLSNKKTKRFLKQHGIPEPTRSLLWITDEDTSKIIHPPTYIIEIRRTPKEPEENKYNINAEPSLIWVRLPIKSSNQRLQEPFYYPSYSKLTLKQRWEYLNWLKDVTQKTNLSYVFLYYYGLERHLLLGDYDGAIEEIFRLLKYHNEPSFSHYAISALIAASAYRKRLDIVEKYPEILHELTNESVYLRMLSGSDLTAEDILNLFNQKRIDRNHHVIELANKYPSLFKKELLRVVDEEVALNGGFLERMRHSQLARRDTISFANMSFSNEMRSFKTVEVLYSKELQSSIRKIISETYKRCKMLTGHSGC